MKENTVRKTAAFAALIAIIAAVLIAAFSVKTARADAVTTVTLRFGRTEVAYRDERLSEPDFTVKQELHERRINAPYEEKMQCVETSLSGGATVKAALLYCFPRLKGSVTEFLSRVNREPKNAAVSFRPYNESRFTFTEEKVGYSVSEERLYFDIYCALRRSQTAVVDAEAEVLEPEITVAALKKYTALRASFSTDFSRSAENRKHNIRLALSKLNGRRIESGEEFSFNKIVGVRTPANGFEDAKIIVNGEYVDGTGGGVCQASTTVYNCALLADLKITSARPHSLPPSYVPPSFDAMVNSGSSDLKFVNDTPGPIFIRAFGTEDRAVVEIYGEELPYTVVRESRVISRTAVPEDKRVVDADNAYGTAELADGEEKRVSYGAAGVTSEGYICYYDGATLIERRLIRRDIYKPLRGVVAVKPT